MVSLSPSPSATTMAGRALASPPSRVQTWQAGQNAAAVPVEGVEGEDAETMERVQTSQLMPCPLTPLLPGRNRRRLCRKPLSALGGICQASTSNYGRQRRRRRRQRSP